MRLTDQERAMRDGAHGEGVRKAMEIVVALGTIYGAEDLVPVSHVQVSGVSYKNLGDAGLEFVREWAAQGARVRVPTTLNPAGMDLRHWRELGFPVDFAMQQQAVLDAFAAMGIETTCTCTPYLVGYAPRLGDHVAWGESSAVSYANSVIGARTNREGGPGALAAAIVGRTARYGLHLDGNRVPQFLVDVRCPVQDAADWGALGYMVGRRVANGVPYLRGLDATACNVASLKALGAAMAASGAVALYHVEGVTPEAGSYPTSNLKGQEMAVESLDEGYAALNTSQTDSIDLVWIGCPHAELAEIERIADRLDGRRVQSALWITAAHQIRDEAESRGLLARIEASGGRIVSDTCLVVAPVEALGFRSMATNSGKGAFYGPGHAHVAVHFGSLEQCLEAAISGEWIVNDIPASQKIHYRTGTEFADRDQPHAVIRDRSKPMSVPTPEAAYAKVERLVKKFKALSAAERRAYNEAATRQAFILPLFEALGWNTDDPAEVSPEEKVSRGWVDYAFRLSGIPRFFLETKKIAEDITDPRWVKQAIDYAWTKGVTWALLSDFEGLRVFNAEWKEDDPRRAQFLEFSVDTYLSDFERLWWLSRQEIAAGRLDREAEKVGKRTRKEPVSQHLFDDLKGWRHELFRHLRGYNGTRYSPAQIDEAVLRILNRLIFIRTAEDREVEPPRLLPLLRDLEKRGRIGQLPGELAKLFREMDATYNSDLFGEHFSETLDCEPTPFVTLIEGLHEKRSGYVRYNFNAIDADVLGTVYEQYLGHVVAAPKAAEVLEKRKKRKAQGIYYTPTFVVKYIVQQTLGRHLEEYGYNPAKPVRVLDMACGSGSFLIEAFDVLDRHLAQQRQQARGKREDVVDYARRMEILSQNIYGVDKDEQALAVAKLNLSLKALHMRDKLPMLDNLRAGDSLISGTPDELKAAFGKNWQAIKPFNWETEFSKVMKAGGFNVIVGNPPYVQMSMDAKLRETFGQYLVKRFGSSMGRLNTFGFFIHRGIDLLRPGGSLGFIVPNTILTMPYYHELRQYILDHCAIEVIGTLKEDPFAEAVVENVILILRREDDLRTRRGNRVLVTNVPATLPGVKVSQREYEDAHKSIFHVRSERGTRSLSDKLLVHTDPLGDLANINQAIALKGDRSASLFNQPRGKSYKPVLDGRDIGRYVIHWPGIYLKYDLERIHSCKREDIFLAKEKLFFRRVGEGIVATLDDQQFYALNTLVVVTPKTPQVNLKFILGVMNSRLMNYYFAIFLKSTKKVFSEIQARQMSQLPICRTDFDNPKEKQQHDAIVALVDEMLQLQKDYAEAELAKEDRRHALKRRIDEVDAAIDQAVYQLYGLTAKEIKLAEGSP